MEDMILYLLFSVVLAGVVGLVIGHYRNVYWLIRQKRRLQKKDFHLAYLISKDKKALSPKIFDPEESMIWHNGICWTVEKYKIYRQDKPDEAYRIKEKDIKMTEEGIPTLFLDEDTFRPIDFDFKDKTEAKPGEAGAILKSWVVNQLAKSLATMKRQETYMLIAIILSLAACGIGYWNHMSLDEIQHKNLPPIADDSHATRLIISPPPLNESNQNPTNGGVLKVVG